MLTTKYIEIGRNILKQIKGKNIMLKRKWSLRNTQKGRQKSLQPLSFLLGSGASVDAGVPPSERMSSLIIQEAEKPDIVKQILNLKSQHGTHGHTISLSERAKNVCNLLHFICENDSMAMNNIEQLYRDLRLLEKYWNDGILVPKFFLSPHNFYAKAINDTFEFVDFMLNSFLCPQNLTLKEHKILWESANYLTGIWNIFTKIGRFRLDIFTLNYDIAIEAAMDSLKLRFTTGFQALNKNEISCFAPELLRFPKQKIVIYKLHGSHRWCAGFSELPMNIYVENIRKFLSGGYDGKKLRVSYCDPPIVFSTWKSINSSSFSEIFSASDSELLPMMIWADANKARWSEPYRTLHECFQKCVPDSGILIVIGYGWCDEYLNDRIMELLTEGKLYAILIVDPEKPKIYKNLPTIVRLIRWFKATAASALLGDNGNVYGCSGNKENNLEFVFLKKSTFSEILEEMVHCVDEFMNKYKSY